MPERLQTPCSPISAPSGSAGEPPTPPGGTQAAPTARLPLTCTEPFPREQAGSKLCCLGFYYLFIRTYEKKKNQKHFHTLSRSGAGERKEGGKGYKTGPRGREEAALCPPYARLRWEEGGESRWGLRHRWHKAADDQQNGLLEGGTRSCPGLRAAGCQRSCLLHAAQPRSPPRRTHSKPCARGRGCQQFNRAGAEAETHRGRFEN